MEAGMHHCVLLLCGHNTMETHFVCAWTPYVTGAGFPHQQKGPNDCWPACLWVRAMAITKPEASPCHSETISQSTYQDRPHYKWVTCPKLLYYLQLLNLFQQVRVWFVVPATNWSTMVVGDDRCSVAPRITYWLPHLLGPTFCHHAYSLAFRTGVAPTHHDF